MTDKEYKKHFGIPANQPLVAKSYSDKKRESAQKNKLGEKMLAGRKAKATVDVKK
jgi:predicted transcriptional regulator